MESGVAELRRIPGAQPGIRSAAAAGFPLLPGLRDLLPGGVLARGSVATVPEFGLLFLALAAEASAAGAWCGLAGVPEAGLLAAAGLGLDSERVILTPHLDARWPLVVSSLLDGCEIVLVRPPARAPAQLRRRMEAALRRAGGVLLVAGEWPGAHAELRVVRQEWAGLGDGHGRLRACRAEVVASGRGAAGRVRGRWLWLPGEDGTAGPADPPELAVAPLSGLPLTAGPVLRAVRAG